MYGRVAEISRDGIVPVRSLDGDDSLGDFVDGLVPADAPPAVGRAFQRMPKAIRVFVNILQAHRFGADVPAAEWVIRVAADRQYFAAAQTNLDTADCLAKMAGAVVLPDVCFGAHCQWCPGAVYLRGFDGPPIPQVEAAGTLRYHARRSGGVAGATAVGQRGPVAVPRNHKVDQEAPSRGLFCFDRVARNGPRAHFSFLGPTEAA